MTTVPTDGKRKRVFIRTYGCQMNVYDSDRMADVLRPLGYALAPAPEQADLVVLNTCHIREHASEKVYSELGRLRDEKQLRRADGRDLTIAVAGCVAQAEGDEAARAVGALGGVVARDVVVLAVAHGCLLPLGPGTGSLNDRGVRCHCDGGWPDRGHVLVAAGEKASGARRSRRDGSGTTERHTAMRLGSPAPSKLPSGTASARSHRASSRVVITCTCACGAHWPFSRGAPTVPTCAPAATC